jgi:ABC-type sugar transport system substrate-binding protein
MVVVATMTWARSPLEEAALRPALERLAAAGFPVVVADRGTIPDSLTL